MPPPTLIATPGATTANTYATLAQADAYHEGHALGQVWRSTLVEAKQRALLTATRLLDQYVVWAGTPSSTTQRLAWPRQGLYSLTGAALDSATIPERVQEACAEFARQLVIDSASGATSSASASESVDISGLTSLKVGSIAMSFKGATVSSTSSLPNAVWYLVSPWGTVRDRAMEGPIALSRA